MPRFALKFPYYIVVACLMLCIIGVDLVTRMPVDLFPPVQIPVVVVATFYPGMPAEQIERDITSTFERFFTLGTGISKITSNSMTGVSLIKITFQPGFNPNAAVTSISNLAMADLRRLPRGTLPPVVLPFDASSLPVCLVTLNDPNLTEAQIRDLGQYQVRQELAVVPGASVPQPFGGQYRQIMVYVDPLKLNAYGLSLMDVVKSVNSGNIIVPSGDVKIGPDDYDIFTNSQINLIGDINNIPLRSVDDRVVTIADVGYAKDSHAIQTNIVRVDGQPSVYLPILKQGGDSNTVAIVAGVRQVLHHLYDVPKSLVAKVAFDQSAFVKNAIDNLVHEGLVGLILTGLMVLVFLASPRAIVGVLLSIPLSVLATFIVLAYSGNSINTMILGGLALVFSRVIFNSVVVLENIFRHMEHGESPQVAAEVGGDEVATPVLAATITTAIVFLPVALLSGVSKYLFTALAIAVVLALFASYVVAMTVVPLFCARFVRVGGNVPDRTLLARFGRWFNGRFEHLLHRYDDLVARVVKRPGISFSWLLGGCLAAFLTIPLLGLAYFPRTDAGQFVVDLKAPVGTRIEITEQYAAQVESIIRRIVLPRDLGVIASNIGITPGFSSIYTSNAGPYTAFVQVSLKEGHRVGSYTYMDRVRAAIHQQLPQLTTFFQSGGLVDAILNQGLPAPVDVQVQGNDLNQTATIAAQLQRKFEALPEVSDAYIPQDVNAPSLTLNVNRQRAEELGLTQQDVADNLITALTSNDMIAPGYYIDPKNGNQYFMSVQYPENQMGSFSDLNTIPVRGANGQQVMMDEIVTVDHTTAPTVISHYQLDRVIDVYVNSRTENLRQLQYDVHRIVDATALPSGVTIAVRGTVNAMDASLRDFMGGLLMSAFLVYLVLVVQFRSFIEPIVVIFAVPPGLAGALLTLWLSGTTLNVMSLMGLVMMVGIVVSNGILIVELAHRIRETQHEAPAKAVAVACRTRLRPILMTSLATIIGLIPMSLGVAPGSESYAPLARVVIGGLTLSVIVTIFIVPSVFVMIHREQSARHGRHEPLPTGALS